LGFWVSWFGCLGPRLWVSGFEFGLLVWVSGFDLGLLVLSNWWVSGFVSNRVFVGREPMDAYR